MLEQELKHFKNIQEALLAKHPDGGFAVIKGEKLLGVWINRADAIKEGVEAFGNTSMLVKNINEDPNHVINFTRSLPFKNVIPNL